MTFLVVSLKCISMNNQECETRPGIIDINSNEPVFFLTVFLEVNAVVIVIISTILMLKIVFRIMQILKYSIQFQEQMK